MIRPPTTTVRLVALVTTSLLLVACTATSDDPPEPTTSTTGSRSEPSRGPDEEPDLPDTRAGDALGWVLDAVGTEPGDGEVESRFDPSFLEVLPAPQVRQTLASIPPADRRVELVHSEDLVAAMLVSFGGQLLHVQLALHPDDPHRIVFLLFTPGVATPPVPSDLAEAPGLWADLAPEASLLVAEIANGECRPLAEAGADVYAPIGSTAKLYVLGAVAAAVESGVITWDQPVPIRDELKSLPSGTFQELEAGTERTVAEHAKAMIGASDNTATDHLIHLVGREAVEAALVELGHSEPGLNRPFLSTRELFVIKYGLPASEAAGFVAAGEGERRAMLDGWADHPLPGADRVLPVPTLVREVEWFASPSDLCRALVVLDELSRWPGLEPLDEILAPPEGLVDLDVDTVWFKGGSEPGVLNATLMVRDDESRRVMATGTLVDPEIVRVATPSAIRWLGELATLALGP